MKIGQLMVHHYDEGCGSSEAVLETCKNIGQLESIAQKMNKKHGNSYTSFNVRVIDTATVKDSLSRKDMSNLYY